MTFNKDNELQCSCQLVTSVENGNSIVPVSFFQFKKFDNFCLVYFSLQDGRYKWITIFGVEVPMPLTRNSIGYQPRVNNPIFLLSF